MLRILVIANVVTLLYFSGQLPVWGAQAQKEFDVVSVKRSLDVEHAMTPGWRSLKYDGGRFSANLELGGLVYPVRPDRTEFRDPDLSRNYYRIEAVTPAGTTLEDARLMLRKVLVDRLGLEYRFEDKPTAVFNLVRGKGPLKLTLASGSHQNPVFNSHGLGSVTSEVGSLVDLAGFLTGYAGRPVVDKTGISENFALDIDWHVEMEAGLAENHGIDPAIAIRGVKDLGLNLVPATKIRQFLVIAHLNPEPTPN
jgi:uncharacterized protein (TIGR03435 family)